MPTRRIDDEDESWGSKPKLCLHPEHNPPGHMVFKPGKYEHTCPGCGRVITFYVTGPVWCSNPRESYEGQVSLLH